MKISYNWLKDHITLQESAEEISAMLTKAGLEVEKTESFESIRGGLKGVVIGKVVSCERIPETEKLKKTTVDIGAGKIIPVVCGAANVAAGQKVLVATVDTVLYPAGSAEPLKIKKAKLKGEPSEGMICAEDELGLGASHEGIMVLDTNLPEGTPAAEYLNLSSDVVFEIGLTPNRADAASHYGVARDLRALLKKPLTAINTSAFKADASKKISITVENKEACPRYCGLIISNIKVTASPQWLQNRLSSIGVNPINNIVDITNYILHDLGQPLHAFDLDKVKGNKIVVKNLPANTEFTTLDAVKRKLQPSDLMICNESEPMCIAGVFGGLDSGVSNDTTSIFLESAYFSPAHVRKASTNHGLKTDSSFRFERGTDPNMPPIALMKAALMIQDIAGGEISSELYDLYPEKINHFTVQTSYQKISDMIGKSIPANQIKEILTGLDITIVDEKNDSLTLSVPPYKVDVQKQADIVEEILRIYGYDNIELDENLSSNFISGFPEKDQEKIQRNVSLLLSDNGFNEIITNSLTNPLYTDKLGITEGNVFVLNKLSEELGMMRRSLLFSGLEIISYNINRRNNELKLYEFGKTYEKTEKGYSEKNYLSLFVTGDVHQESWNAVSKPVDFHYLNQIIQKLLGKINLSGFTPQADENKLFEKGYAYKKGEKTLISFGAVKNELLQLCDIKQPVFYAEVNADLMYKIYSNQIVFREIPKFPEVRRDLSLVLDKQISFDAIQKVAKKNEKKLLTDINVFDVYEGKNIGEGKKSYSVSFILQDNEQTLTDKVIDQTMEKLMKALESELGAVIRK